MSEILQTYFALVLGSLGYPVDEIRWSLGYCQGDGMRFSGSVDATIAAHRLLADKPVFRGLVLSAVEKGERIDITASDRHYVHEYTMTAGRRYDADLTLAEDKAMSLLLSLVEEDIVRISQRLRDDGYACIEAAPSEASIVIDRTFGDFGLKVSIQQDEEPHLPDSGEALYDLVDMIEFGKGRQGIVMVSVRIEREGEEIGSAHQGTYPFVGSWQALTGQLGFRSYVRELLGDACAEVREILGMTGLTLAA
ncbi:hypothetical protein [Paraburkholderia humisilvae]|uniref:Uncharacterized protein n=1 Tax=Paraburkholderia humisilvae TaxID=627669 RepID=A0A6J5DNE6_9BURK|nr:hypothetical protein [Paraburkholderia humisilvae]CAB3754732.1 hypothetical protein LMG29542_02438 [Paraburkholderia humisilvae]